MTNSVKNTAANMVSNSKANFAFMAFGKGQEVKEFTPAPKFIGLAPFYVLGVNPNKAQLKEWMNIDTENEPTYTVDNNGTKSVKLEFIVKTNAEKANGVDFTTKATFWIKDEKQLNSDGSKMKVIDIYGVTAWVTPDEFAAKATLLKGKNGMYQSSIDSNYRGCYVGEEEVVAFIKTYLNIPNTKAYINGSWVPNPNIENVNECACCFDEKDIQAMFSGDFSSVKEAIAGQPLKMIQLLTGIKTTTTTDETGAEKKKSYQTVYTNKVLYAFAKKYEKLIEDLTSAKYEKKGDFYVKESNNNTFTFEVAPIHEFSVTATEFKAEEKKPTPTAKNWGFAKGSNE